MFKCWISLIQQGICIWKIVWRIVQKGQHFGVQCTVQNTFIITLGTHALTFYVRWHIPNNGCSKTFYIQRNWDSNCKKKVQSELWSPISLSVCRRDNCVKCQLNAFTEYTGGQWALYSKWTETCTIGTKRFWQKIKATLFVFTLEIANRLKLAWSPDTTLPAKNLLNKQSSLIWLFEKKRILSQKLQGNLNI